MARHTRHRRGALTDWSSQAYLFPMTRRERLEGRSSGLPTMDPVTHQHYRDFRGGRSPHEIYEEDLRPEADEYYEETGEYLQISLFTTLGAAYQEKQEAWLKQLQFHGVVGEDEELTPPFAWLRDLEFLGDVQRDSWEADTELEREILTTTPLLAEWGWYSSGTCKALGRELPELIDVLWPLYVAFIDSDRAEELLIVGTAALADQYQVDISDWLGEILTGIGATTVALLVVSADFFQPEDFELLNDRARLSAFVVWARAEAEDVTGDSEDWVTIWPQLWRMYVDEVESVSFEAGSWDFW